MNSIKCPSCRRWIGAMEVHEDCARKQDEAPRGTCGHCDLPIPDANESPIGRLLCACNLDLRTGLRRT